MVSLGLYQPNYARNSRRRMTLPSVEREATEPRGRGPSEVGAGLAAGPPGHRDRRPRPLSAPGRRRPLPPFPGEQRPRRGGEPSPGPRALRGWAERGSWGRCGRGSDAGRTVPELLRVLSRRRHGQETSRDTETGTRRPGHGDRDAKPSRSAREPLRRPGRTGRSPLHSRRPAHPRSRAPRNAARPAARLRPLRRLCSERLLPAPVPGKVPAPAFPEPPASRALPPARRPAGAHLAPRSAGAVRSPQVRGRGWAAGTLQRRERGRGGG